LVRSLSLKVSVNVRQHLERVLDIASWDSRWWWQGLLGKARALIRERAVVPKRSRALQPMVPVPQNQPFDLATVLADSGLMEIINSIESYKRSDLVRVLWLHSPQKTKHEYSWLFHIFTPVTRLPLELLQQILLIVIDEVSDPSALVHVCKLRHVVVTGIWTSLKLGPKTTKDDVIQKLERNQSFLDIFVDTEMDHGDISSSYEAIFTVVEAAARWRSSVDSGTSRGVW